MAPEYAPPPPPSQLGRFEVGAKIGGGGMATVYLGRATRDDGTEQVVALKVIRDEFAADEQFASMFVDEAKILARLRHPNVIRTLEYGITGKHRYIAMELLSGRTFGDVWDLLVYRGERMPLELGAWICARVAAGLHGAHELVDARGAPLNVIHRDVNPSNIFLTHSGEVKLIDFGLAKARMRRSVSVDGIVKGKIPYLAPEQAQGKPIDRRTDVYALGVTLWETATMKRLFKRDTDVETLKAIYQAHVPDVREMIDGFPEEIWRIIDKALQRDPDARYATAEEMRIDLDAFVRDGDAMKAQLAEVVSTLFPGQEREHEAWARAATATRVPKHTMPPPAPVPIVSSTMLEDALEDAAESSPASRERPSGTISSARPATIEELAAAAESSPAPPVAAAEPSRPEAKPAPNKPRKKKKSASSSKSKKKSKTARARAPEPPPAKRSAWISVAIVILVVAVLATIFASR